MPVYQCSRHSGFGPTGTGVESTRSGPDVASVDVPPVAYRRGFHLHLSRATPEHSSMRTAFKEWAVIVDALGRGEQILILRKGGIDEGRGGFRVEHPEFLLFPTRFHQQREQVTPEAQARYDVIEPGLPPPDRLRLEFLAQVVGWRRIGSQEEVLRLSGQHRWRDEVIAERFEWGHEQAIHLLALRVLRLPHPVELPLLPAYGGCRSWVELAEDVATAGSSPVIDEAAFGNRMLTLETALGGALNRIGPD